MIETIAVEDNDDSRELLVEYISQTSILNNLGTFSSSVDALEFVKHNFVQVIFLDIELPQISGIEFIQLLDEYFHKKGPYIVFSTAFREYAVEGYEYDRVIGYLHKPYSYSKFLKFVQKAEQKLDIEKTPTKLSFPPLKLKRRKQTISVPIEDILYIKGERNSVVISLADGTDQKFYMPFHGIEDQLPSDQFIRIHKSYVVAKSQIEQLEGNTVRLRSLRVRFPVGITFQQNVKAFLS